MTEPTKPEAAKPTSATASAGATAPAKSADAAKDTAKQSEPAEKKAEPATTPAKSTDPEVAKAKQVSDEELDAAMNEPESDPPTEDEIDSVEKGDYERSKKAALEVIEKLAVLGADKMPKDTPDSFNMFGYGGTKISYGDIHVLAVHYRTYGEI